MITPLDFSFLLITRCLDVARLRGAYESIRRVYPQNEIVIVYDGVTDVTLSSTDTNLIEVICEDRVYYGGGYNLALSKSTKPYFIFMHDDTFPAKGLLENLIPYVSEKQLCNFTTVEPPLYNDPDTLGKPIKDFGRSMDKFDVDAFDKFCEEHMKKIGIPVVASPYGGAFMAGMKRIITDVGGFDETFKPFFYEDADLILRLHAAGIQFVQVLNSIVYHMGSMTSRGTKEGEEAMKTTPAIFVRKWKTTWEYARLYTLTHGIAYKRIPTEIKITNCPAQLEYLISLISEPNSDMIINGDASRLNQQDIEYLQTLPYVLQSIEEDGQYELGNLTVNYKKDRFNG